MKIELQLEPLVDLLLTGLKNGKIDACINLLRDVQKQLKSDTKKQAEKIQEFKPCSRLSDCACVRIEGKCKGPTCDVYSPSE